MKQEMNVTITFTTPILGTVPKDKEIYAMYVLEKAREIDEKIAETELETVKEVEEKGWTGFHEDEHGLFIYSYMVKGFLKAACESLMATGDVTKITAYKKWFDKVVFVEPRNLYFGLFAPDGVEERPLRAMTAQGPRVTVARSDKINEGRSLKFKIVLLKNDKKITEEVLRACLDYGAYVGIGQWRGSGGFGQFVNVVE